MLLRFLIVLFSMMQWVVVSASEVYEVTLEQAIAIALGKSFAAKTLILRSENAGFGLNAAKARFRLNAQLRLEAPSFSERVSEVQQANGLPVFNTFGTTRYQGALDISQPLPTDGVITLSSILYHRNESVFVDPTTGQEARKEFYSSLSLRLRQPLFAPNKLKLGLEKAKLDYERSQGESSRSELDIIFDVKQSFYSLYRAQRSHSIAKTAVEQQKSLYDLAKQKFEFGLIPEVESLQMEVDYAQSQNALIEAEGALRRQENDFKLTLGLDLSDEVKLEMNLDDHRLIAIDEELAVTKALANRAEVREQEIAQRMSDIALKEAVQRNRIKLDLDAFLDITGVSDPDLNNSRFTSLMNSSFDDMMNRPKNRGIVLNVAVPLWDSGANKNEVGIARNKLEENIVSLQQQRRQIEVEVLSAVSRVREAQGRLKVLSRSEEIAEQSFEISRQRFDAGAITSQELALDRERLTNAKTSYLNAYIEYQLAIADLQRKTLWDFEKNQSLLKENR